VILSACSPYFHSALAAASASPGSHPVLMVPPGVSSNHLTSLVDFMYHGEVSVKEEQLDDFLKLAEMFQVRGLVPDKDKVASSPAPPSYSQSSGPPPSRKRRLSSETPQRQTMDTPRSQKMQAGEVGEETPAHSQMVGLVCPQCRTICRGVAALEAHMTVCRRGARPVGQVAPEQRGPGWGTREDTPPPPSNAQNFNRRRSLKDRPAQPPPQQGMPGRTYAQNPGMSPRGSRSSLRSEARHEEPSVARPEASNISLASSVARKFGGAVSISKVTVDPPKQGRKGPVEQAEIKEEPVEHEEYNEPVEDEEAYQQYPTEDYEEEEGVYHGDTGDIDED